MRHPWTQSLLTLTVALAGLGVALAAGLPLPFLFGPMAACLVAALLGAPLRGFAPVSTAARTVLGVAVGASVTPALLAELPSMALSLAIVPLYVVKRPVRGLTAFSAFSAWRA